MKWHWHHGIYGGLDQLRPSGDHRGAAGHHTSRSRNRVHPRHDGGHIILLLFDSVLFYELGVLLLLLTDLKSSRAFATCELENVLPVIPTIKTVREGGVTFPGI